MLQAAELLFGSAGRPHDYLQEALFRLLAVGFVGAASQNWILKVQHIMLERYFAASHTPENVISGHSLPVPFQDENCLTNTPSCHTCTQQSVALRNAWGFASVCLKGRHSAFIN